MSKVIAICNQLAGVGKVSSMQATLSAVFRAAEGNVRNWQL